MPYEIQAEKEWQESQEWNKRLQFLWAVPEGLAGTHCDNGSAFEEKMRDMDPDWCRANCGKIIGTPCRIHMEELGIDPDTLEPVKAKGRPE